MSQLRPKFEHRIITINGYPLCPCPQDHADIHTRGAEWDPVRVRGKGPNLTDLPAFVELLAYLCPYCGAVSGIDGLDYTDDMIDNRERPVMRRIKGYPFRFYWPDEMPHKMN